ncbi:hypothetical protein [uncultured Allofournierella sp.]|uniref:hypothetical protein n=1 Tax=uncultured Allofournierella sp. TaxID=1940258 RepID=UPI00374FE16E
MMLLKFPGALLLVCVGFGVGREWTQKLRHRCLFWQQMGELLCYIQDAVFYQAVSLESLHQQLVQQQAYPMLNLQMQPSLAGFCFPDWVTPQQSSAFRELFSQLGCITAAQLCDRIPYYVRLCEQHQKKQQELSIQAEALYPKAGFCAGLLAAILLF